MTVRPVLALPHKVLQTPSSLCDNSDDLKQLATDLIETMQVSPGCVGLAAPQIGIGKRAFVVDVTGHKKTKTSHGLFVLFNPEITQTSGRHLAREGCMSVPDLTGDVTRAEILTITGLNEQGESVSIETDAFEARAIQHEMDHLNGLLFLDRVESSGGIFPRKVYR